MTKNTLTYINSVIESLGIPYNFMEFKDPIESLQQYWVGEYSEIEMQNEDGMMESNFILTGTSNTSFLLLEQSKDSFKTAFPALGGHTHMFPDGQAVAIFYASSMPLPTLDDDVFSRMQVNLTIKEWMVE